MRVCTASRDEIRLLTQEFPKHWHLNLHIRYEHATMALLAQSSLHQPRQRISNPMAQWDAGHLDQAIFHGLDGDIRVNDDTIAITYINVSNADQLPPHYENLPDKFAQENIAPHIPWLYDLKLDFRFK